MTDFLSHDIELRSWFITSPRAKTPFSHAMLADYIRSGDRLHYKLTKPGCLRAPIQFTTILRDPLERYWSSVNYFQGGNIDQLFAAGGKNVKTIKEIHNKLLMYPENLTASEATSLVNYLRDNIPIFLKLQLNPYEHVLTRCRKKSYLSSNDTLKTALTNLRNFHAVGTMEDIESYFVLLHKIFKIDLKVACNKHVTHHNIMKKNGRDVESYANRKSLRILLQPDTLEVFLSAQQNEFAIWDFAKQLHVEQLSKFGLTVKSSQAYFRNICSENITRH